MDRRTFQGLAELRLSEARRLLEAGCPSGAYYLGGYAVECALKACFAKTIGQHDFPDKRTIDKAHTHNLETLSKMSEEGERLIRDAGMNPRLNANWGIVKDWKETSRYTVQSVSSAAELLDAIDDPDKGVLTWLKRHW